MIPLVVWKIAGAAALGLLFVVWWCVHDGSDDDGPAEQ